MKSPERGQMATPVAKPSEPPPPEPAVVTPVPVPVPTSAPAPTPPPAVPAASVVEAAPPSPAPETKSSGRGLRVVGIVCGAAGLASIGTAIYFYTRAVSLSDKVSNSDTPDSDYLAGRSAVSMQWVFYLVGAGALATGRVLYWLGWPSSASTQAAASLVPMVR